MSVEDRDLTDLEQQLLEEIDYLENRVTKLKLLVKNELNPEDDYMPTVTEDNKPNPRSVIEQLPGARGDGVRIDTVLDRLRREGFDDPTQQVKKLRRQGDIYNPDPEFIKVV